MFRAGMRRGPALAVMALVCSGMAAAEVPSPEQMWEIIQAQQRQIEDLQQRLAATNQRVDRTDQKVAETEEKVEITGDMIEEGGMSLAASWAERTSIGGYGELHYNDLDSGSEMDFHRFVLFFGHQFNDRVRFMSELEIEHALVGDGEPGEVEVEQAYVELDLNDYHSAKAGLFLVPVGILNETHEPPTFYGVERNPVESNIVPSTWWEGGAGMRGELAPGLGYDFTVTSGLDVPQEGSNAFRIRNGRQKVAEARAESLAYTGRLRWTGVPGVELAMTAQYQEDITQGDLDIGATLLEAHAAISRGPFGLRALYARWDLDNAALIDGVDPAAAGRDRQEGWYVEPSLRGSLGDLAGEFGAFLRYNVWDNNAGANNATERKQYNAGINYWPTQQVVFKLDFQRQDNADGTDDDGFNLGVGYQF
ncbi:MAG: OprO/OprP family phosphate-selective porin [Gammaproteobacteria bacterium]|nr:OprO/OprP family phosphate-selective porin [Gammaproteobacteria bacterium]MDH4254650.1 OprO/OprP family phosphate-selective porin [Gammaproteobacteria bacterium]MDH5308333.1 OprO/OprP family phosphate-selective porin [Gammaproteobacteria bacterium]